MTPKVVAHFTGTSFKNTNASRAVGHVHGDAIPVPLLLTLPNQNILHNQVISALILAV